MKLLISHSDSICINIALARELGLYESTMLLAIYKAIDETGIKKSGIKQIARTDKQLKEMFSWCKPALITKTIERLQAKEYIIISDQTLFDDQALWFGLNWEKLREIKSLVIFGDDELLEAYVKPEPKAKENGDGESRIHQVIFGAFLKACRWYKSPMLSARDKGEAGSAVKALIKMYPDREIDALRLMVLGIDVWRVNILKQDQPFRPYGIMRKWTIYSEYCQKVLNNRPPQVPEGWYD